MIELINDIGSWALTGVFLLVWVLAISMDLT